jgi:hypothetical protein
VNSQAGDRPGGELHRAIAGEVSMAAEDTGGPNPALPLKSRSACFELEPVRSIELSSAAAVILSDAESFVLPIERAPLLVSLPPMLRTVPPAPALSSTLREPVLSTKVVTERLSDPTKRHNTSAGWPARRPFAHCHLSRGLDDAL